ncbi:hypothetical protein CMU25_18500 [Elizabethkingia anophelis]|nr:hypothetical protein [Elizabethkingia anophelis]MDV3842309.1 hypothetical protein [Elizabethkingia anophelis]
MDGFSYLSLITDAYSRKIVGYALYPTLEVTGCIQALIMAVAERMKNHKEAKKAIDRIVHTYNDSRPHSSLDYLIPNKAHTAVGVLKKRWKQYKRNPTAK